MSAQSAPNFDLCVVCKTSRLLCGEKICPLLKKWFSNTHMVEPKITKLDDSFAPPAFFVGYVGYPRINAGPMITADRISSELIDNAEAWVDKTQEEIVQMRLSLFRTHSRIDAKKPLESDIIQRSHEVLLGVKSVDVEIELEKPIIPRILLNERTAPSGPIAPIKKLTVTENQTPLKPLEKAFYDTDLKAGEAVGILGKEKIHTNILTRVFSAGMLGVEKNRKLVPTRWSITAIDQILSKQNITKIKNFQELGEYRIFKSYFFGNRFAIIFTPDVWSFELIEAWFSGSYMNPSIKDVGVQDHELYKGRTSYAQNTAGGYYASRLGVTEYLMKIQRQAQIMIFREIDQSYRFPLGVWVVRQGVRLALANKYETADTIEKAIQRAKTFSQLKYPLNFWKNKSELYKFHKNQTKLDKFLKM